MQKLIFVACALCFALLFASRADQQNDKNSSITVEAGRTCGVVTGNHDDWAWAVGECHKRETARLFAAMGQEKAAFAVLCTTQAAKEAKACQSQ